MRNNNKYHILKGESKQKHPNHNPTASTVGINTTQKTPFLIFSKIHFVAI